MDRITSLRNMNTGLASGTRAAALVIVVVIVAVLADHSLLAHQDRAGAVPGAPAAYASEIAIAAPPMIPELRAHQGEVPPHVQAF